MKKNNSLARARKLKSSNHRRVLIKKLHHRVLLRRKQFDTIELTDEFQEAC